MTHKSCKFNFVIIQLNYLFFYKYMPYTTDTNSENVIYNSYYTSEISYDTNLIDTNITNNFECDSDTNVSNKGLCTYMPVDVHSLSDNEIIDDVNHATKYIDCLNNKIKCENKHLLNKITCVLNNKKAQQRILNIHKLQNVFLDISNSYHTAKVKLDNLKLLKRRISQIDNEICSIEKSIEISEKKLKHQKNSYCLLKSNVIELQNTIHDINSNNNTNISELIRDLIDENCTDTNNTTSLIDCYNENDTNNTSTDTNYNENDTNNTSTDTNTATTTPYSDSNEICGCN